MRRQTLATQCLFLILSLLSFSTPAMGIVQAEDVPVLTLNAQILMEAKRALAHGDEAQKKALAGLMEQANRMLHIAPISVTHKTMVPPSGDKHDYMSLAPYWFPDPSSPNGLPYIRRDGIFNPESKTDATDVNRLGRLCNAVEVLGLAYFYTEEFSYAQQAARLLRAFFLAPETRMNPHLKYAQAIRGVNAGRGIGIIDSRLFLKVIDGIGLISKSGALSQDDLISLQQWFKEFVHWLRFSPEGQEEAAEKNNHGTWFDAQLVNLALFVGDIELAKATLLDSTKHRIQSQILEDGRQPLELARTRPFHYSVFNLEAFFLLAHYGDKIGVNLWDIPDEHHPRLQAALNFLADFEKKPDKWPYKELAGTPSEFTHIHQLQKQLGSGNRTSDQVRH